MLWTLTNPSGGPSATPKPTEPSLKVLSKGEAQATSQSRAGGILVQADLENCPVSLIKSIFQGLLKVIVNCCNPD